MQTETVTASDGGRVRVRIEESTRTDAKGYESQVVLDVPGQPAARFTVTGELISAEYGVSGWGGRVRDNSSEKWAYAPNLGGPGRGVIVLFGYPFASSPGAIYIFRISSKGPPQRLFYREEFGFNRLAVEAGELRLVGMNAIHEAVGDCASSYDPYSVLTAKAGAKFVYSLQLSRAYNLKHYVWAGPKSREDLAVEGQECGKPLRIIHLGR